MQKTACVARSKNPLSGRRQRVDGGRGQGGPQRLQVDILPLAGVRSEEVDAAEAGGPASRVLLGVHSEQIQQVGTGCLSSR